MFFPSKPLKKEKLLPLHRSLHNPLPNCLQLLWLNIFKKIRNVKSSRCNRLENLKVIITTGIFKRWFIHSYTCRQEGPWSGPSEYLFVFCLFFYSSCTILSQCLEAWEPRWGTTGFNSILARLSGFGYTPSDRTNLRVFQDHSSSPRSRWQSWRREPLQALDCASVAPIPGLVGSLIVTHAIVTFW